MTKWDVYRNISWYFRVSGDTVQTKRVGGDCWRPWLVPAASTVRTNVCLELVVKNVVFK